VKQGIGGTHYAVSTKYLQGYLNEYVWRYNRHDDGQAIFLSLLFGWRDPCRTAQWLPGRGAKIRLDGETNRLSHGPFLSLSGFFQLR